MANKNYEALIEIGGKVQPSLRAATNNACKCLDKINNTIHQTASNGVKAFVGMFAIDKVKQFTTNAIQAGNAQVEAETKLEAVLKNVRSLQAQGPEAHKKATVELLKQASALQKIGVIGDEVTIAGMQQLATFQLSNKEISALAPGMTDLLAQQKGLNATQQDAVNIGNMIGKAMTGQVGALSRVGITFTKSQAHALKFGNSVERAKVLAEVLKNNVGGVNKALAQTDQGKIKQFENSWGDVTEEIGNRLTPRLAELAKWATEHLPQIQSLIFKILDVLDTLINIIQKYVIPVFIDFYKAAKTTLEFIKEKADIVVAALAAIGTAALVMNINNIAWALLTLGLNFATLAGSVWTATVALLACPLTWIAVGIGLVVGAIVLLVMHWDTVKAKVVEVWNIVVTTIQNAWAKIQIIFDDFKSFINLLTLIPKIAMAVNTVTLVKSIVKPKEEQTKRNALGSASFAGGNTLVGEQGPELVNLPRGSRIFSNTKTNSLLGTQNGGVNVNITINGNADPAAIQNAASASFTDFQTKYNALLSRNRRLGYA